MQDMEDENAETEQPNLLQQERQEEDERINNNVRIPQAQPVIAEGPRNIDDAQPLLQAPQEELLRQQLVGSASRLLAPSNRSRATADSDSNIRRPRHHRDREETLATRRQNYNEVERTSVPEQHNDSIPMDDDDSEAPTPASWSTVPTYGGTPPSERSRTLFAILFSGEMKIQSIFPNTFLPLFLPFPFHN